MGRTAASHVPRAGPPRNRAIEAAAATRTVIAGAPRRLGQLAGVAGSDVADTLTAAFEKLANAISTDDMRRMNMEVDGNKRTPKEVASEWLATHS